MLFFRQARGNLHEDLPVEVAVAATETIQPAIVVNPYRVGKPLDEPVGGFHSARRGTYRIIHRINAAKRAVEIHSIRHRRDACRSSGRASGKTGSHHARRRANVAGVPQPILRTDRLLLVPLADRHLDLEIQLDSDPEVLRYLFGRGRSRDEVVTSHARRMELGGRVDGLGYWMAFGSADAGPGSTPPAGEDEGDFVGLMMLPPAHGPDQPDDPTVSDLGYRLLRRHWRKGLASEASRALLRHAFDTVGQRRVIAQTMTVNTGSQGVMKAVGMRYVRTYFPTWEDPLPGAELGEVEYEMTREMWAEHRGLR